MKFPVQRLARIGGWLYLLLIALGFCAEMFVRAKIIQGSDAAATSARLIDMETLWRGGILAEITAFLSVTILSAIYFILFRPVNPLLNLIAAFLRIVAIAIQSVALMQLVAALYPLGSAPYLHAFTAGQLQAMSFLAIRSFNNGYSLALLFFGFCFLFHGQLIARSGFLPRTLGRMIQVSGLCYFSFGVLSFASPASANHAFPFLSLPAFIGEFSLCMWLIIKGVDSQKWHALQADVRC